MPGYGNSWGGCALGKINSYQTSRRHPLSGWGFTVSLKQLILSDPRLWKEGAFLCIPQLPCQVVGLALGRDRWQLQGLCCCFSVSAEPTVVTLFHEGNAPGVVAFPCSSAFLHLGPRSFPRGPLHALGPRICFQHCALSTEVLHLCMPRSYSYALQQMFYGSSVISTLHCYARGTDLISCSLSWQGMGALLRQCAKPQMGREKEYFSIALQWPL